MESVSDKEKIENGEWVSCWICETAFRRKRETRRYCATCHRGVCEGEHGTWAHGGRMKCVICGAKKSDKER